MSEKMMPKPAELEKIQKEYVVDEEQIKKDNERGEAFEAGFQKGESGKKTPEQLVVENVIQRVGNGSIRTVLQEISSERVKIGKKPLIGEPSTFIYDSITSFGKDSGSIRIRNERELELSKKVKWDDMKEPTRIEVVKRLIFEKN